MEKSSLKFKDGYVRVSQGWLHGDRDEKGNLVCRGIPYGLPPAGSRRFAPPEKAAKWIGIREAVSFGPEAVQEYEDDPPCSSEDSLYLNVWTPAEDAEERLPVFVWIHGGAFLGGSGSDPMYRAETLACQGMVVVTVNYRLGILGFMAHPSFEKKGNFGLMDQILALQWVKENISAFGGNPQQITIGGQSAGACSVGFLLVSELTGSLFDQAIMESGSIFGPIFNPLTTQEASKWADGFVEECLDGKTEKLYEVSAEKLNRLGNEYTDKIGGGLVWRPCIDGYVVKDVPERLFRESRHHKVNLLAGCTEDEFISDYTVEQLKRGISQEEFKRAADVFGEKYQEIVERYPYKSRKESLYQYSRIKAAVMLEDMKELLLENRRAGGGSYLYRFEKFTSEELNIYRAPHSAELPYLFGKVDKGGRFPWYDSQWKAEDYKMAAKVQKLWASFIRRTAMETEEGEV